MADDILKDLTRVEDQIVKLKYEQTKINKKLELLRTEKEELGRKLVEERTKEASQYDWTVEKYEWSDRAMDVLRNVFKLKSFRSKQLAAINATMSKEDVLLLMPTGGGKSLCYQLPAVLSKGVTLVVSPLLSLIQDQIVALKRLNVEAESINSSTHKDAQKRIYEYLSKGTGTVEPTIKLIYVTPEWLAKSKRFMSSLQKCFGRGQLDRIAIDEVHCCSQWGHDFRTDYKFLGLLKSMFPNVPIIGLTATATMKILIDVQTMLEIDGCTLLKASYNRPNLYYEVRPKPAAQKDCVAYLKTLLCEEFRDRSGIIYTGTIKETQELTTALRQLNVNVNCYHADLEPNVRHNIHRKWLDGTYQAVIATIAFGMGIDKPDVRFVVHHVMPKSVESFYQESGRAGRDGKPAKCILMYRLTDVFRLSSMVSSKVGAENLYAMLDYCLDATTCRRSIIASHFDEMWDINHCDKACDHCKHPKESKTIDITSYCTDLYKIIENAFLLDVNLTALKLIDAWFKTGDKKLRIDSVERPKFSKETGESIIGYLLVRGYLKEDKSYTAYSVNCYLRKGLLSSNVDRITMIQAGKSVTGDSKKLKKENKKRNSETLDEFEKNKKIKIEDIKTETIDIE